MARVPLNQKVTSAVALTKGEAERELPDIERRIALLVPEMQLALPDGLDPQQMARDAIQLVRKTPKLALCQPISFLGALMTCAQLGLRPGVGALGQAHILPFWNSRIEVPDPENPRRTRKGGHEAAFVIGYEGMIELMNRSGRVASVTARCVYEGEEFDVEFGSHPKLTHKPNLDGLPGDLRGFYSVIHMANGGVYFDYWNKAVMERHRDRFALQKNKQGQVFGPWVDHFEAMGKKTMIRQAFKNAPRSTELSIALAADETVRHTTSPLESIEELVDVAKPIDHADVGEDPVSNDIPIDFPIDTSPGAPTPEEQYEIWRKEQAEQ